MKRSLSLLLLLACGFVYAGDQIDQKQWSALKEAVFKKMGQPWTTQFILQHERPSESGVRVLAQELDFDEDDMDGDIWFESKPPQLNVKVDGEPVYGLTPGKKCTEIVCKVRQEMRNSKNQ
jgi:hypothetical protein